MNVTYEQIKLANDEMKTTTIKHKDKKTGVEKVKEYPDVLQREIAFRKVYPTGFIRTTLKSCENKVCIFYAEAGFRDESGDHLLGTGTAQEKEDASYINKTSYIENCETSAVGRALAQAGFGGNSSLASADEVTSALLAQSIIDERLAFTKAILDATCTDIASVCKYYQINDIKELTAVQMLEVIKSKLNKVYKAFHVQDNNQSADTPAEQQQDPRAYRLAREENLLPH